MNEIKEGDLVVSVISTSTSPPGTRTLSDPHSVP